MCSSRLLLAGAFLAAKKGMHLNQRILPNLVVVRRVGPYNVHAFVIAEDISREMTAELPDKQPVAAVVDGIHTHADFRQDILAERMRFSQHKVSLFHDNDIVCLF